MNAVFRLNGEFIFDEFEAIFDIAVDNLDTSDLNLEILSSLTDSIRHALC